MHFYDHQSYFQDLVWRTTYEKYAPYDNMEYHHFPPNYLPISSHNSSYLLSIISEMIFAKAYSVHLSVCLFVLKLGSLYSRYQIRMEETMNFLSTFCYVMASLNRLSLRFHNLYHSARKLVKIPPRFVCLSFPCYCKHFFCQFVD